MHTPEPKTADYDVDTVSPNALVMRLTKEQIVNITRALAKDGHHGILSNTPALPALHERGKLALQSNLKAILRSTKGRKPATKLIEAVLAV